ncbi:hypothetical protein FFF34_010175 [Inquilinus sp. KBS0705]|nr:hypothetical protein FFF34_010175 [Inquilinus sp. KBS0705]
MIKALNFLLLFAIAVCSNTQLPADKFIWGINGHPLTQVAYTDNLDEQVDLLTDLNVKSYRFDVLLDADGYAKKNDVLINIFSTLQSKGINSFPVLMLSGLKGLDNAAIYQKTLVQGANFANRYGKYLSVIEVNNEADNKMMLPGDLSGTKASDYDTEKSARIIASIKGFIDGAKRVKPNLKVSLSVSYTHYYYLQLLQDNNVNYDIIGCHWYSNMGQITRANPHNDNALEIITRFQKPIWITEFNFSKGTAKATFARQRDYIDTAIPAMLSSGRIKALFIYELLDQPELKSRYPFEADYGLVKQDFNGAYIKKDAYQTFKRITHQY